jgi:peptidoglycan/LPS O-acetylase OafA/YrhL
VISDATDSQGAQPTPVRPEIQALRAVAVMTVVIFHLWPEILPGGFVGVDVFFAISGFLITLHLLREVERTGRVSIPGFWARRARRILPAALVVLAFCAITTLTTVPQTQWDQFFKEIRASTLYVENWQLAADAVDYQAQDNAPSSVQHFWSLSAEEQFYLVWPVLILLAIAMAGQRLRWRRRGRPRPRRSRSFGRHRSIALVLGLATGASLIYSIVHTEANPLEAYFVTPTRAWEFGAGGLLAVLATRSSTSHPGLRAAVSWAGMAAIVVTVFTFSDATPFPSYTALLPILGAVAVIWAGAPNVPWAATPLLALPPVQFLGNVSYSIYLWHWPLLILAPFALDRDLDTPTEFSILGLTILAAWITKVLVEDPMRKGPFLTRRKARYTFAFAAVGTAIVLAIVASGNQRLEDDLRKAEQESLQLIASKPRCFGAASRDPEKPCKNPSLKRMVVPTPAVAARLRNSKCSRVSPDVIIPVCSFGVKPGTATKRIALMGDSHAQAWRAAMKSVALAKGWQGLSVTRTGCGYTKVVKRIPEPFRTQCVNWVKTVPKWYAANPDVDTVFVVGFSGGTVDVASGGDPYRAAVKGFIKAWNALPPTVKHIIVLRDNPLVERRGKTAECVERAIGKKRRADIACKIKRGRALLRDPAVTAARQMSSPRVQVIDLTRFFCDKKYCYPVIGGALVYKDLAHITREYATTLGPYIQRYYERLAAGRQG